MPGQPSPEVLVALATFRRPTDLARILPELVAQTDAASFTASVLVVDNDPEASARDLVDAWAGVRYVHEPRPGIAAARNRALDEAASAHAVVFVDDDELPLPGWLESLVGAWKEWGCAGVAGPTSVRFTGTPDAWVRGCGVFDPPVRDHGQRVAGAATNNLLLDRAALRRHGLRFDDAFGISGGSDTRLIHQLIKQGGEVRWCASAVVLDYIPPGRSTRRWALRRTFRTGNAWSRVALDLADRPGGRLRERVELTARAVHRAGRGACRMARGRLRRDVATRAQGEVDAATAVGVLLGAWGYRFHEYRRPASAVDRTGG